MFVDGFVTLWKMYFAFGMDLEWIWYGSRIALGWV